jgi:PPK2 family polyphosphate:nucleotide phosphotransferase
VSSGSLRPPSTSCHRCKSKERALLSWISKRSFSYRRASSSSLPISTQPTKASTRATKAQRLRLHATSKVSLDCSTIYAEGKRSLLIVLQGLDASGKDGVIRHVFSGTNPQGVNVTRFQHPTEEEMAYDFLWRAHRRTPAHGEIMIFNRSHYEDVLIVRVHNIVPKSVWSSRYDRIREFEHLLTEGGTHVLKFYLHVSPEEQLARFKKRLDDPQRNWKIRDSDYTEREHWPAYIEAIEDAIGKTTTARAPWYIIPSNHKWFRIAWNLSLKGRARLCCRPSWRSWGCHRGRPGPSEISRVILSTKDPDSVRNLLTAA